MAGMSPFPATLRPALARQHPISCPDEATVCYSSWIQGHSLFAKSARALTVQSHFETDF